MINISYHTIIYITRKNPETVVSGSLVYYAIAALILSKSASQSSP